MDLLVVCYVLAFGAMTALAWIGISMFTQGWKSYEERYVKGAERSLESLYLFISPGHVMFLSVVCLLVLATFGMVVFSNFVAAGLFGLLGFYLPKVLLRYLEKRRMKAFEKQLVELISIIRSSLRSGSTLPVAVEVAKRQMANPMSQEMGIVAQQLRLGDPLEEALKGLFRRIPSEDLDLMITAITISENLGGNLTRVLENLEDTIREKQNMEGKIKALTSQGKTEGALLGTLPPFLAVLIYFVNPGFLKPLFTTPLGLLMVCGIVVFEVFGFVIVRKIATPES